MSTQDGIATAGRCFLFGLLLISLTTPLHHCHFQLFALDAKLDLPDGFNHPALLKAMQGHVLAKGELVGVFQAPQ